MVASPSPEPTRLYTSLTTTDASADLITTLGNNSKVETITIHRRGLRGVAETAGCGDCLWSPVLLQRQFDLTQV